MTDPLSPPNPNPTSAPFDPVADGHRTLAEALDRYRPVKVFALFSGGHDSLCSSHLASRAARFDGCVHIDTGIGIEETRAFVRDTCRAHGWPLVELRPPVGYDETVLRYGFPGPGGHTLIYNRLKERCLRRLTRDHKAGRSDRVMLVTGVRRSREPAADGVRRRDPEAGRPGLGGPAPELVARGQGGVPGRPPAARNDVVATLCMSGECLCGAFARKGEFDEIALRYPAAAARVRELEARAAAAGVPCRWGQRPGRPGGGIDAPTSDRGGLCWSCRARREAEGDEPLSE